MEVDVSKTAPNSTRWILDVEHDTSAQQAFDFQLLDNRSKKAKHSALISLDFTPRDAEAAKAHLHAPNLDAPTLTVQADNSGKIIRYRVTANAIHSSVR